MSDTRQRRPRKLRPCSECGGTLGDHHIMCAQYVAPDVACNCCGASSFADDWLVRALGQSCPYCGEGVIQEVNHG